MSDDDYNFYAPGDYPANYPNVEQQYFLNAIGAKSEDSMRSFGNTEYFSYKSGPFYKGLSQLELAAQYDFEKGVEILLDAQIHPDNVAYDWNMPALCYAILNDNLNMAKLLLKRGANPNAYYDYHEYHKNPTKKYPLGLAIEMDSPLFVHKLLKKGANPNVVHGDEPLIVLAAKKAHPCVIDLLAQKGADINAKDKDGNTALHIAALNGNIRLAKKLIEKYHANTLIQNNNKDLPMHMAMQNPNIEVLKLLQKHGTPIYQENIGKESVASLAVKSNNSEILKTIFHWLRPYESIYLKDPMINSLLLSSIQSKSVVSTTHLLKHTPDLNAPIYEGMNPLQYICEREDEQQLNALLSFDGQLDINKQDNLGYTALHYACKRQNKQMVLALLEKGADATLKNHFGEDSLFIAKQTNNLDFLNFVKEAISTPNKARLITKQPPLKSALNRTDRQNS